MNNTRDVRVGQAVIPYCNKQKACVALPPAKTKLTAGCISVRLRLFFVTD
jgi:hypothetical protein